MKRTIVTLLTVLVVTSALAVPATAGQSGADVDECRNADKGPTGDAGPPGFVGGIVGGVAGFLGDLVGGLPVPGFVKGFFGASTC